MAIPGWTTPPPPVPRQAPVPPHAQPRVVVTQSRVEGKVNLRVRAGPAVVPVRQPRRKPDRQAHRARRPTLPRHRNRRRAAIHAPALVHPPRRRDRRARAKRPVELPARWPRRNRRGIDVRGNSCPRRPTPGRTHFRRPLHRLAFRPTARGRGNPWRPRRRLVRTHHAWRFVHPPIRLGRESWCGRPRRRNRLPVVHARRRLHPGGRLWRSRRRSGLRRSVRRLRPRRGVHPRRLPTRPVRTRRLRTRRRRSHDRRRGCRTACRRCHPRLLR